MYSSATTRTVLNETDQCSVVPHSDVREELTTSTYAKKSLPERVVNAPNISRVKPPEAVELGPEKISRELILQSTRKRT
jgi:hypothetical protein